VRRTLLALGATTGFLLPCSAGQPERVVVNNTLLSQRDPAVEIRLPAAVRYVGTDRFVLTDPRLGSFDDCELYAFVEPDTHRNIRKLYWVQFEAYLPNQPQLHHTYDSPRHVTLGGLDFYLDTWVSAAATAPTPGSDEAYLQSLLASQRLRLDDSMSVRLVHLTDATRRKELMVIYAESLAPTGFSAAQLQEHGADHAKWAAIEHGLIRRAEQSIAIRVVGGYPAQAPH
jgi:predicted transcriptional regulator